MGEWAARPCPQVRRQCPRHGLHGPHAPGAPPSLYPSSPLHGLPSPPRRPTDGRGSGRPVTLWDLRALRQPTAVLTGHDSAVRRVRCSPRPRPHPHIPVAASLVRRLTVPGHPTILLVMRIAIAILSITTVNQYPPLLNIFIIVRHHHQCLCSPISASSNGGRASP